MEFNLELIRYRHTVGESGLHLQFTPAYRRPIFINEKVMKLTKLYMLSEAKRLDIAIAGIGFGPDHVHVFVANWKNFSIKDLTRKLKGYTSKMMRKNHWKLFKSDLYGKKFWSEGYFHRTVGSVTKQAMEFYIKNSQDRHWKKVDYDVYMYQKQSSLSEFSSNAPHFSAE